MKILLVFLICSVALASTIQNVRVLADIPNCYTTTSTGQCSQCDFGYVLKNSVCLAGQFQNCKTFDPVNGVCTSCFVGKSLQSNGACLANSSLSVTANCALVHSGTFCLACKQGSYFNPDGNCELIDPNCQTFDYLHTVCFTCKTGYGYSHSRGQCVQGGTNPSNNTSNSTTNGTTNSTSNNTNSDPLCAEFSQGVCTKCVFRAIKNSQGVCVQVNPQCNTFDANGKCLSCYQGYVLSNGNCVINGTSTSNNTSNSTSNSTTNSTTNNTNNDPLCADFKDGVCKTCVFRAVKNAQGVCVQVNPQCNTFDANGKCLSCYPGYVVSGGNCIVNGTSTSNNTSNSTTNGTTNSTSNNTNNDPLCAEFSQGVCTKCVFRAIKNSKGVCVQVNPLCNTFDANGLCLSCYQGYVLSSGQCTINGTSTSNNTSNSTSNSTTNSTSNNTNSDPLCAEFSQGVCTKCVFRAVKNAQGVCVEVNPLCNTFDANGKCLSCYPGYVVSGGSCIINGTSASNNTSNSTTNGTTNSTTNNTNSNPLCAEFSQGVCTKCVSRAFKNSQGICVQVNPLCNTFDANGHCLSCYQGYVLSGGNCVLPSNTDPNCQTVGANGVCSACWGGYYYNSSQGKCVLGNPLCNGMALNGDCLACYNGYYLKAGKCQLVSPFCATFDSVKNVCTKCYQGYTLANGTCS